MSTQSTIPTPQIAHPLLYIALSPDTNNPAEPDAIRWSFLVAPSAETLPADGLLYTYAAHDHNTTSSSIIDSARVGKFTRIPLRLLPVPESDTTPKIVAHLLIAEVSSLDTLDAHIGAWSEEDAPPVDYHPTGNKSVTGVMGVLEVLQKVHEEEEKGTDAGSKGSNEHCLGRRMGSFESVKAEGRQLFGSVTKPADGGSGRGDGDGDGDGVPPSMEAWGVPTRVLFDLRGDHAVGAGKQSGGGAEAAGKGKKGKNGKKGGNT